MQCGLGLQISGIDVAVLVTVDHHHLHAGHLGGCRVSAVGRFRNQADVAVGIATALVITRNSNQARVFALGTGVRLHTDGVEAGNGLQPVGQTLDHFEITGSLLTRRKRMHIRKGWPGNRNHLAGGVELHGARAQRDHGMIQRQITILQRLQVAQHLVFGMVRIENRVRQNRISA